MALIALGGGTIGSFLATLWLRTTERSWPDKETIIGLAKVFYGIGALGVVMYLFMKYA
jgi:hypothetical protein